ncbi:MAG TPA: phosphatase PAP2 family protein [Lysobacter sp.]
MRAVPPPARTHWPATGVDARFHLTHLVLPLAGLLVLAAVSMGLGGDLWLADRVYALQGGHWAWRDAFLTQQVVHRLGRDVDIALWLGVLLAWCFALRRPAWTHLRMPLAYLLVSTALAMASVAWLKSWSNMDCPWDLLRYGGERPYVGLLAMRPVGLARGACFPAGHASGGYAWLALYFFFGVVRPRWRWIGLAAGIASGLVFGVSQQLRGAHFLSHDLVTAAICWAVVLACWQVLRMRMTRARWANAGFASASRGAA